MRNFKIKSGKWTSTLKDAVFCNYLSTNCILCLKNFDEGGWHFHSFPCVVRHFPQSCCQQPRLDSLTFTPEAIGSSNFTHNYPPNYRQTATGITFSWHNARCVLFCTRNYPRNYPESVAGIALCWRNACRVLFFTHNYPRNYPCSATSIALSWRFWAG